jgi:hypothetical protein
MYSRQLEQLAHLRHSELRQTARTGRRVAVRRAARRPIRSQTGWALVALGLRIAASGGR